jgi:phage terminase large subunit
MWLLLVLIIMPIDIDQYLNPNHEALFQATDRELIVYGGAGAGKSFSIADKLLLQRGFRQMPYRCLCVRKTLASVKKTTAWFLEQRAKTFGWDFDLNKSDWTARCGNGEFIFAGMNSKEDYQKIKSMTDIDFIWVNEAQEIRETDYNELLLRLRGQTLTEQYAFRQIICDFNPIGKFSWVYQRFFEKNIGNSKKLRYTVESNP